MEKLNNLGLLLVILGILCILVTGCNQDNLGTFQHNLWIECNRTTVSVDIKGKLIDTYTYNWSCVGDSLEINYTGDIDVSFSNASG